MHALAVVAPSSVEYLPKAQPAHTDISDDPVTPEYLPAAHFVHLSCPVAGWYEPASQSAHCGAASPENFPLPHSMQLEESALATLPAAHDVHSIDAAPVVARNVPGPHPVQLVWPESSWYWPAAQAVHSLAPAPEKAPLAHGEQLVEPWTDDVPAAQFPQLAEPAEGWNCPAAQLLQSL
jgi:hypothetical protein